MAITPLRVLLFVLGGLIGGAGAAYFAGVFTPVEQIADAPEASDASRAPQAAADATGQEGQSESSTADDSSAGKDGAAEQTQVVVPAFDLLRAEPDGSLVVAGRAAPDADVEVLSGSSVLATTKSGPSGDFAAVVDEPLKPGEHNIVLRARSSDTIAATSMETAIVSIPSAGSNEVVALVQQPGEPSRLISVPHLEASPSSDDAGGVEQQPGEPPEGQDAPELRSEERSDAVVQTEGAAGQESGSAEKAAGQVEEPAQQSDGAAPEEAIAAADRPPADDTQAADAGETPADEAPEASGMSAQGADEAPQKNVAGAPDQPHGVSDEAAAGAEETEIASSEMGSDDGETEVQSPAEPQAQPGPATDVPPFIEAVEIDGRQVFVAGRAEPRRRLRAYANEILLGQTTISPEGRFLIEAERDLPVGDYIIRADVLADDGVTVIARAAVPFERHVGEQIAAVAPEALGQRQTNSAPAERVTERSEEQALGEEMLSEEATSEPAAAGGETEAPAAAAADPAPDVRSGSDMASGGQSPEQSPSVGPETGSGDAPETGSGTSSPAPAGFAPAEEIAAAGTDTRQEAPSAVEEVVSPALQSVEGSVIIRRGDTLWHISRRVYGHGIRYTTIYLANEDQIRDPDLIWPGQIFTVPEETEEGEKADLSAIGDQALTPREAMSREEGE